MNKPLTSVFKNFTFNILIRVLLLTAGIASFIYLLITTELYATLIILLVFNIFILYSIIHYVTITNRQVSRFLSSIRHSDFSQSFVNNTTGSSFEELNKSFNEVIHKFRSEERRVGNECNSVSCTES